MSRAANKRKASTKDEDDHKKAKTDITIAVTAALGGGISATSEYERKMSAMASVAAPTLPTLSNDEANVASLIIQWKEKRIKGFDDDEGEGEGDDADDVVDEAEDGASADKPTKTPKSGGGLGRNPRTEVLAAPVGVFIGKADLIPKVLRDSLHNQFNVIANNPNKDYHPGSNEKVLNLVHPSMYPFVAGRSVPLNDAAATFIEGKLATLLTDTKIKAGLAPPRPPLDNDPDVDDEEGSNSDKDGKGTGADGESPHVSYIANHKEVLGRRYEDSMYQWMPAEFAVDANGAVDIKSSINSLSRDDFPLLYRDIAAIFGRMVPMFERCLSFEGHQRRRYFKHGQKEDTKAPYSMRGKTMQVIVKAANYVLRAGETDYKGSWHVEGMSHERIIASGIYYYHTDTHLMGEGLMFRRRKTNSEVEENDGNGGYHANVIRDMGTVPTPAGSCLVFHNQYQHCVDTLRNTSDRIAERKILCFFLVDPAHPTISTAHIGDQRRIRSDIIHSSMRMLPYDVASIVCDYATIGMSHNDALAVRTDLMKERKYFVDGHNEIWTREYSLCEH